MSDIDVDDSKSEILDVGDAGSDNIGDEEVCLSFQHLLRSPSMLSRRWSEPKCPQPPPSLLSGQTRGRGPLLPSYLPHLQVVNKQRELHTQFACTTTPTNHRNSSLMKIGSDHIIIYPGWYSSLLSSLYHSSNALANNNNILEGVKTEENREEDEEESEVRQHHQGEQEKE